MFITDVLIIIFSYIGWFHVTFGSDSGEYGATTYLHFYSNYTVEPREQEPQREAKSVRPKDREARKIGAEITVFD